MRAWGAGGAGPTHTAGCLQLTLAHLALQASQLAAGPVQLLLQRRRFGLTLLGSGSSRALRSIQLCRQRSGLVVQPLPL